MAHAAAFFDLDRTLLQGSSGPTFSRALRAVGVMPDREIPGEAVVFRVFDAIGETLPAMLLTRQAARMASGWNRSLVQDAGRRAATHLVQQVQPYARLLIDQHHAEGRKVVMATTSPYDLVLPLAEALGFDAVLATKYGEHLGSYDGSIAGHFVWGPGKLNAVKEWALANRIDLRHSWAYSDSLYDIPLLSSVGHPVAVNPDLRLRLVAAARRWPAQFLDVPTGVPKLGGVEPQQILQAFARPELFPWVRFDIEGVERIPTSGPAILVGNHRSYFDPLAIGFTVSRMGRPVRFLGKKEVFDAPIVGQIATAMGGIRVDRGTGSDEPLQAAAQALEAGEMVMLMPQGTIPRGRAFFDPELKGRWGAAKLAAATQAPVIPLGLWGTEAVWPRNAKLPNLLNLTSPPTVRVRVGDAVPLDYEDPDEDTRRIMAALVDLLPPEAREHHEPTPEELARTFPSSYKGDPDAELDRRPGTD